MSDNDPDNGLGGPDEHGNEGEMDNNDNEYNDGADNEDAGDNQEEWRDDDELDEPTFLDANHVSLNDVPLIILGVNTAVCFLERKGGGMHSTLGYMYSGPSSSLFVIYHHTEYMLSLHLFDWAARQFPLHAVSVYPSLFLISPLFRLSDSFSHAAAYGAGANRLDQAAQGC